MKFKGIPRKDIYLGENREQDEKNLIGSLKEETSSKVGSFKGPSQTYALTP